MKSAKNGQKVAFLAVSPKKSRNEGICASPHWLHEICRDQASLCVSFILIHMSEKLCTFELESGEITLTKPT